MSSVYGASEYDWTERRPDKPLVVKCNLDGTTVNKRITFSSSRTCTYDQLRRKVEQCFSLSATSYMITYTDDDGESTDITTDSDLSEAIQYFHPALEDPPLSSAASILSGRSFGRGKITLRVKIRVDYDGPSLSDTSSLISMEEYKDRNGSESSFSFSSPSVVEFDDDSVTVSSKDMASKYDALKSKVGAKTIVSGSPLASGSRLPRVPSQPSLSDWDQVTVSSIPRNSQGGDLHTTPSSTALPEDQILDTPRLPGDPSLVFERLKLQESYEELKTAVPLGSSPLQSDRGAAWLRDQKSRTLKSMLGNTPEASESDQLSVSAPDDDRSVLSGELALQKGPQGRFYYTYTSGTPSFAAHSTADSGYEDSSSIQYHADRSHADTEDMVFVQHPLREKTSERRQGTSNTEPSLDMSVSSAASSSSGHHNHRSLSEPLLPRDLISTDIPPELLPWIQSSHYPPPRDPTDCSSCGAILETLRYICATCGEKKPRARPPSSSPTSEHLCGKGKAREIPSAASSTTELYTYPPIPPQFGTSPNYSTSSYTLVADENPFHDSNAVKFDQKPLPALPRTPPRPTPSPYLAIPGAHAHPEGVDESGYELCANCIQSVGLFHALESLGNPGSSPGPGDWPPSPEEALQLRRTAPKRKGQLRHAYTEKIWGAKGWVDVVQDDVRAPKCSTCNTTIVNMKYKCTSCEDFSLCRACYSQVHEIHPSHAFLVVPEKPPRTRSEPIVEKPKVAPDPTGEESMVHPGVKCAHCLLDIVGARFHCAICPSVDICSNCEGAGLPGNLDDNDGSHSSSHIMIKIPYPLPSDELQIASSKAKQMWDKDAPTTQGALPRSRRDSLLSSYARTVLGPSSGMNGSSHSIRLDDHKIRCDGCNKSILGTRYQCASCVSKPKAYNLCESCEGRSYVLHNARHIFFKLQRPLDTPIECEIALLPSLYKAPAGPPGGTYDSRNPKAYLLDLRHPSAVCDRCMDRINGEWFRCVYCGLDLCGSCESNDTHEHTHFFMVFKAPVDMQEFRRFALLENDESGGPVVPHPVYDM